MNRRTSVATGGLVLSLVAFILCGSAAAAEEYEIIDLGTLGGIWSRASALNSEGAIVGSSPSSEYSGAKHGFLWIDGAMIDLLTPPGYLVTDAAGVDSSGRVAATAEGEYQSEYAYLWEEGSWTDLGTLPGLAYSAAADINDAVQIAGSSFMLGPGGGFRAWLWEDGVLTDLGTLGGEDSSAAAINELGQVAGHSDTAEPGTHHAFLWDDGVMIDLGVLPGETDSTASDLNESGQVCGQSAHTSPVYPFTTYRRACLWDGSDIVDIGKLPGFTLNSAATGINNPGTVVGHSTTYGNQAHAFVWEDGVLTDLNDLIAPGAGWELEVATDINDAGQITGYGTYNGQIRAFRLDPIAVVPDVKINGQDEPLFIKESQAVAVTVSLDPKNMAGTAADWWVLASKSGGGDFSWLFTVPWHWMPGIQRTYAGPLAPIASFSIHDGTIPAGTWTLRFAVDELNNGYEGTYEDFAVINVTP